MSKNTAHKSAIFRFFYLTKKRYLEIAVYILDSFINSSFNQRVFNWKINIFSFNWTVNFEMSQRRTTRFFCFHFLQFIFKMRLSLSTRDTIFTVQFVKKWTKIFAFIGSNSIKLEFKTKMFSSFSLYWSN